MGTEIVNEERTITRDSIIIELHKRQLGKTVSFEEAYMRGKDFINNLWS